MAEAIHADLFRQFEHHHARLRALVRQRVEEVRIDSVAHDNKRHKSVTAFCARRPDDQYKGDAALRDLQGILAAFDANGCAPRAAPPERG